MAEVGALPTPSATFDLRFAIAIDARLAPECRSPRKSQIVNRKSQVRPVAQK
jgi:hypothetical protein